MAYTVVIGATGDVGRGIVGVLLERGHQVTAVARHVGRLSALMEEWKRPATLQTITGSVESDDSVAAALQAVRSSFPRIDNVVVSINAPRESCELLSLSSHELSELIRMDLVTHYSAARAFLPALAPGGVYVGIGGGSADFILDGGIHMSIAQAGLRMLYRGLAHETAKQPVEVRQLIIASVVNGASTRDEADPLWVTDREVGEQVAAMLETPRAFPGPIWRIARRDESGRPVVSAEGPTRVQGFRA